uniref:Mre11 DNA-binding domain-containing protein n=1 Tax=Ditylenchus dipsaci TaxID=166011 RepID=A0A915DHK9_9BILA
MSSTSSASTIKFLIASDVHAGYGETKKHIHSDSFDTFREVLKNGVDQNVDFVLLGGDLFHENNPSRETLFFGDFPTVNYEDANLNIAMPVFTIHGNHDDLSGKGLTALDVLHETGLINLFGKFNDVDQIEVSPILLRKGDTKIAIYGISSQRDDRLCRAFMKECVKFLRPNDDPEGWFSVLVVHQNRPRRSTSRTTGAFLPIHFIPPFFDLVIWGHEHESLIEPQYFNTGNSNDPENGFFIIQPGSTVATSLCREEAVQKHCGVITVKGRKFKCTPIPLQTTRQVIVDELVLDDSVQMKKMPRSTVRQKHMEDEDLIAQKVDEMLEDAAEKRGPSQPMPPLLRLKVVYSDKWLDIPPINARRFGSRYADKVANAADMVSVRLNRPEKIEKYFTECMFEDKMSVLTEVAMGRSLKEYSNAETTFTVPDKLFNESVKSQITTFSNRLKAVSNNLNIDNDDENELARKINSCLAEMKKQKVGGVTSSSAALDDTVNTSANSNRDVIMEEDMFSE